MLTSYHVRSILYWLIILIFLPLSGQEQVIFHHDFTTERIGWWTGENQDIAAAINDGRYVLSAKGASDQIIANALSSDFDIDGDLGIECELQPLSGPDNAAFGIVWDFTDANNFAYFFIDMAGYFQHGYVVNSQWKNAISWTSAEAIVKANSSNRLKIRFIDNSFIYYINDQMVSTSTRYTDLSRTMKVGFYVGRSMQIQVSQLIFWEEPGETAALSGFCPNVSRIVDTMDSGFRSVRGKALPDENTFLTTFNLPWAFYGNVSFLAWPSCNFIFYRGENSQIADTIFEKVLTQIERCAPTGWMREAAAPAGEPATKKSYAISTVESGLQRFKGKAITLKLSSYVWGHQVELKFVNFDIQQ